jgi:AcrR family transcriptional regulator
MSKNPHVPKNPQRTRALLAEAALETLQEEGYAGTTARAIASRAGVNQALVFYHYGGVDELLLAALDISAGERLARYTAAMADAETTAAKIAAARTLYREDLAGGHVTVIAELVAASSASPALRPKLLERMAPWRELVAEVLREVADDSPLAQLVPIDDVAGALVALYLGLNLLSRLDPASAEADSLFDVMERVAPLLQS